MKDRLIKRFDRSIAGLNNAKQLLANDQIDEFSEALDNGLEGITRVQDDLAVYSEIVNLRKANVELTEGNAELTAENNTLKTELETMRAQA